MGFVGGQSLVTVGFSRKQKVVNRELAEKSESSPATDYHNPIHERSVLRGNVQCNKILTEEAKGVIRRHIQDHSPKASEEAKEPPYMLPSTDPDDYSYVGTISNSLSACVDADKWCSLCNNFGGTLMLCSTCRVSVCVTDPAELRGCLVWDACIQSPTFVFRCPLCTTSQSLTVWYVRKSLPSRPR